MSKELFAAAAAEAKEEKRQAEAVWQAEQSLRVRCETYQRAINGAVLLSGVADEWKSSVSVGGFWRTWGEDHSPFVYGTVSIALNITHWRELEPLFTVLDAADLNLSLDAWKSHDDAASYTRIFEVEQELDPNSKLTVKILATLPGDTDTCRRVLVGYEDESRVYRNNTSRPIYELRCDGEEAE